MITINELDEAKRILEEEFYFVEGYYRTKNPVNGLDRRFVVNSRQRVLMDAIKHKKDVMISAPRQMHGITTTLAMAVAREIIFSRYDVTILVAGHSGYIADAIVEKAIGIIGSLPKIMRPDISYGKGGRVTFDGTKTIIYGSDRDLGSSARGMTINSVFIDLGDHFDDLEGFIKNIFPMTSSTNNGKFVIATTHEGCVKEGYFRELEKNAILHRNRFTSLRIR